MDVRIEHCTVCWGYRDRALALAEALNKRFGARVEVLDGTLGQFDVRVNGKLITSRGDSLLARIKPPRLPNVSDVIAAIERQESLPPATISAVGDGQRKFDPEDAKRFYDRFGAWQDAQLYERAALEHLITYSDFEHASSVFELGCGTGRLAERLFKRHLAENASYVGMDISTSMIRIATRRLRKWSGRATLVESDGTAKLPYPDGAFDHFIATYVLDLLSETAIYHVLSEAHHLLRPNGKLCLVSATEGRTAASGIISSMWKRIYALNPRLVGGCRPLRLSTVIDRAIWRIEHAHVVCSWGICSEVIVACPT